MKVNIENKKILFIHIPKCGGTSIAKCFYNQIGEIFPSKRWLINDSEKLIGLNLTHLTCNDIFTRLKIANDLDYIFTISRNPYHRFISLANWIKDGWEKENSEWNIKNQKMFINFNNLHELIKHVMSNRENFMFKPQHEYIKGFEKIIKIFKIEEGMGNILKKIEVDNNFSSPLEIINTNYSSRKTFKVDHIDGSIKKMLDDLYKKDFEIFKYDMRLPSLKNE